jgi:hypothetical protein
MRQTILIVLAVGVAAGAARGDRVPQPAVASRNILITGYWPPTNEMVRQFSRNPAQNGGEWRGGNWENRGYNIMSYFPEFPGGTGTNPKGNGDFEVDYQDTAADWERIVNEVKPVAIITFSRANTSVGWEMEPASQRFRLPGEAQHPTRNVPVYSQDYTGNRYPSDVPIAAEPVGMIRNSNLPMQEIVEAVRSGIPGSSINPFISPYDPAHPENFDFGGGFLSGYIGYLGEWYRDTHQTRDEFGRICVAAGHIHVGGGMNVDVAKAATEITLRTLIEYVNPRLPSPGAGGVGVLAMIGMAARRKRS